ncbi:hypothetical protein VPH35_091903 [Triticum aestivum]|uniref:Uncharacterized protein n=1 Tax=Triticum turgidum subsp. durum TaxID=4567 RepID=A0A9R0XF11_TRITD|nr:unnamed protein product [Triticum turgidum subsp. durum]
MTSSRSNYRVMTAEEEEEAGLCVGWIFLYMAVLYLGFFAFSAVISYTHVFARATRFDKIFWGVLGVPCLLIAAGIIYLLLREDSPFRNKRATARVADLPPADVC